MNIAQGLSVTYRAVSDIVSTGLAAEDSHQYRDAPQ